MKNFVAISLALLACVAVNHAYTIKSRIVNGEEAKSGQFPFFAFLNIKLNDPTKGSACGASLINDEWLVTAAHCLKDANVVEVHFGEYHLNNPKPEHIAVKVGLDGLHPHPEYDPSMALNDIALIHLPVKLELSENIQPVKLPKNCELPIDVDVIAIGHGKTSNDAGVSMQLNYAQLRTIPLEECSNIYPIFNYFDSFICAQSAQYGYQSVCSGDSGGPLVTMEDNTLIGVADFVVIHGCETGAPQGFTNVYSYLDWIEKVTSLSLPQC